VIIVGLGNPVLSDDGAGWHVVRRLREALAGKEHIDITECCTGGLALAELLIGYHRAILVDSMMTNDGVPGTVAQLSMADLPGTLNTASAHDTNLTTALHVLRRFGAQLPDDEQIALVGIEAHDVWTFAEHCSPAVEKSIPQAVALVLRLLSR
jgi:hydrogenase maturation protease